MITFLILAALAAVTIYSPGPIGYFLRIFAWIAGLLIALCFIWPLFA